MTESTSAATGATAPAGGARRHAHPTLVLLVIVCAQLMVVLDATIVNVALPTMGTYFHKSQIDMSWAVSAYSLAFGGLLLLGGRSGDILGRRRMFAIGLALFSVGSLLGGLATSFDFLLFGRVVQGIGGAIASPTALSLITVEFAEGKERNKAIAIYAAVSGAGAALGLLLGGMLTEWAGWRWVLFVNVPIGVVLVTGAYLYLNDTERLNGRFDIVGALLSVTGMTTLVYGFIHVAHDGWGNTETVVLFGLAVALLVAFVLFEAFGTDSPMMPIHIFDNRNRAAGYLVMLVVGASMFGMFFYISFFIQSVREFSALKTGLAFLPFPFTVGITSQVVAKQLPKLGPKPIIMFGTAVLTGSMFWMSTVDADTAYFPGLLLPMMCIAFAMGCLFVPLTVVAVSKVINTEAGLASALLNVGQQVGGALGVSILASVFSHSSTTEAKHQLSALGQTQQGAHFGVLGLVNQDKPIPAALLQALHLDKAHAIAQAKADPVAVHAVHSVLAHGSAMAFLTAAFMATVAFLVSVVAIRVRKTDLPVHGLEAAAAAA